METIRVVVADQQPLFRGGIRSVVDSQDDMEVVGEAGDVAATLAVVESEDANVVLLDMNLAGGESLDVARKMKQLSPSIAIVMLTPSEDEEQLFQSIKVGAAAYYVRAITPEELQQAIRRVSRGEYLINDDVLSKPLVANRVLKQFREMQSDEQTEHFFMPLSGREVEILDYIGRGNSNKEIARALKISDQTVKNHITSILKKLAVNDRTQAVVYGLRHGWIKMPDM